MGLQSIHFYPIWLFCCWGWTCASIVCKTEQSGLSAVRCSPRGASAAAAAPWHRQGSALCAVFDKVCQLPCAVPAFFSSHPWDRCCCKLGTTRVDESCAGGACVFFTPLSLCESSCSWWTPTFPSPACFTPNQIKTCSNRIQILPPRISKSDHAR